MSFFVKANFIDAFKIGDNINYNLDVLKVLYSAYNVLPDGKKLIKPIILINVSIIEAILFDFVVNRLKRPYSSEILFFEIFQILKNTDIKKLEHYISQVEKYDFFEAKDTNFYDALRSLSKKRNRIHIQNDRRDKPYDECIIFDERVKITSEKVLEKVLNVMTTKFQRREEYHKYVKDFEFPWNRHFKN